jgi:hypothetical protein
LIPINNERLVRALQEWKEKVTKSKKAPTFLALTLQDVENNYTSEAGNVKDGLRLDDLRGLDEVRARVLKEACGATHCSLLLSTVSCNLKNPFPDRRPYKFESGPRLGNIVDGTNGHSVANGARTDDTDFIDVNDLGLSKDSAPLTVVIIVPDLGAFFRTLAERWIKNYGFISEWLRSKEKDDRRGGRNCLPFRRLSRIGRARLIRIGTRSKGNSNRMS